MDKIKIGDRVQIYYYGLITGTVIKQYYPTGCAQQTMIRLDDGREFHAPTDCFRKV